MEGEKNSNMEYNDERVQRKLREDLEALKAIYNRLQDNPIEDCKTLWEKLEIVYKTGFHNGFNAVHNITNL